MLFSFEDPAELAAWELRQCTGEVVAEHAADGVSSLKLTSDGGGRGFPGMYLVKGGAWPGADWSASQALELDVYNATTGPIRLFVTLFDSPDRTAGRSKNQFDLEPLQPSHIRIDLGQAARRGAGLNLQTIGELAIFIAGSADPAMLFIDRIALVNVDMRAPDLVVSPRSFSPNGDGWQEQIEARAELPVDMQWELTITGPERLQVRAFEGRGTAVEVTWDGTDDAGNSVEPGRYEISLRATPAGGEKPPRVITRVTVTDDPPPAYLVWSPPVSQKVRRDSLAGTPVGEDGIRAAGARNERVAFQLVISPTDRDLESVAIEVEDLAGPDGAVIAADAVEVLREAFVQVNEPSHRDWEPGLWWPDPLPPWTPTDVAVEDRHQPVWLEIAVPADAPAGEYVGAVTIRPEGRPAARVPVALTVWDFALPMPRSLLTFFPLYLPSIAGQHLLPEFTVEGEAREGARCVRFEGEGTGDAVLYEMLRPGLQPNREYTAGVWARAAGAGSTGAVLRVKIVYRDKSIPSDVWEAKFPAGEHDWQSREVTVRAKGPERFILVQLMPGEGGTVWLDDVSLCTGGRDNLISNGGFEDSRPGLWQLDAPDLPGLVELHERYYRLLVDHGMNPAEMPVAWDDERIDEYATDPAVNHIRLPFRASWQMGDFPAEDIARLEAVVARASAGGWLDKTFLYPLDEPAEPQYARVREVAERVRQIAPDVPLLITEQYEEQLADIIDIWTPVLSRMDLDQLAERQLGGEVFWWYTMVNPRAPYPTFLVDDYGTAPRVLPWMNARFNILGLLYWNTTQWRAVGDPWENMLTLPWAGANGDGSLLYPGSRVGFAGPVASLRLKLIREGIEDYEYLVRLRELVNRKAGVEAQPDGSDPGAARVAEICGDLFTRPADYTTDALVLERMRVRVAEEIVGLQTELGE